jgi:hypothetical protein
MGVYPALEEQLQRRGEVGPARPRWRSLKDDFNLTGGPQHGGTGSMIAHHPRQATLA